MTVIYIDTDRLEKPAPVFGIICSGLKQEKFSLTAEVFQHPVDSQKMFVSDGVRKNPLVYTCDFFIADNPQTFLEQIMFFGNPEFWKDLFADAVRTFDETFLVGTVEPMLQNSFSAFVYKTIESMIGYELIMNTSVGEYKRMFLKDAEATRDNTRRGMSFNLTLLEVFTVSKQITTMEIQKKYNPKKADTETATKTAGKENAGKLQETSILVDLGAPGL